MAKKKTKKRYIGLKEWGLALGLALIFTFVIKGFVIQSFIVKSPKMEKTILAGDYIMVNKFSYGARFPITPLTIPFFSSVYSDILTLPYFRLPGFDEIKPNDLLVFNYPGQLDRPIDKRDVMVKRCIGIPADTILLSEKNLFVNNLPFQETDQLQHNYRLVTQGKALNQSFLDKYQITEGGLVSNIGIYDFPLTQSKLNQIKNEELVRYVRELKDFPGENTQLIFPSGKYHSYNKDNFGPLVVPFQGQKLSLTSRNIDVYKSIIEGYEGNSLEINNSKIIINGIETSEYTIKLNYYFVLDDNRDNAIDSRYWGFLPESHVVGKASFIWFSYNSIESKMRWNRFFLKFTP